MVNKTFKIPRVLLLLLLLLLLTTTTGCIDCLTYTGCFIMYSGFTKTYNGKTVGHVFTKPVQIEETTQNVFPQKVVFHRSSHFCRWVSVKAEIKSSPINR
jgi:hypothetical protein